MDKSQNARHERVGTITPTKISPLQERANQKTQRHYNTSSLGFAEVRQAATGHWERIHRAIGIQLQTTNHHKHTPCPACGGRDRFRVLPSYHEYGSWYCSGGGNEQSGDGFTLLCHVKGYTLGDALKDVKGVLGLDTVSARDLARIQAQAEAQAERYAQQARLRNEQTRVFDAMRTAIARVEATSSELEYQLKAHEYRQRQLNTIVPFENVPLFVDLLQANQALSVANAELYQLAKQMGGA